MSTILGSDAHVSPNLPAPPVLASSLLSEADLDGLFDGPCSGPPRLVTGVQSVDHVLSGCGVGAAGSKGLMVGVCGERGVGKMGVSLIFYFPCCPNCSFCGLVYQGIHSRLFYRHDLYFSSCIRI